MSLADSPPKGSVSGRTAFEEREAAHRAGFVALVGPPSAGKSTLLNRLVGQPLAIVSPKPQTTRRRILGIARRPGVECILLDTPGAHTPKTGLGRAMMRVVRESLGGSDVVLLVLDGCRRLSLDGMRLLHRVERFTGPWVAGINKTDRAPRRMVRELGARCEDRGATAVVAFSARTGANVETAAGGPGPLFDVLTGLLPFSPPLYDEDQITDLSEAFLAAELVRERMLVHLRQEVPHTAAVRIEEYDDAAGLLRITASLLVDRASQRGIVIGRGGRMLRRIGTESRLAIEKRVGRRVFLDLTVKVRAGWRDNPGILRHLGLG